MQRLRKYLLLISLTVIFDSAIAQQNTSEEPASTPSGSNTALTNTTVTEDHNSAPFVIRNIIITGNRKTKSSIILREIPFKPGDHFRLQELVAKFENARQQLMNLALFNYVVVALKSFEGYNVDILVEVKERWYIFPVPYFKMVDRNLNQWLVQNKGSLDRVSYGFKLIYNNFTGVNDKLNVWLMSGYTRQVSASYERAYIDKKMKWGGKVSFALGKNREVNYLTVNNKEVFLKDSLNFVRSFFKTGIELTYRRAIKTRHRFGFSYNDEKVQDTVVKLNPEYFAHTQKHIRFPELSYNMIFFNVDYIPYPLKGLEAQVQLIKRGFSKHMNLWELKASMGNYFQLFRKTYLAINTMGVLKLPFKQPFFNTKLMGYGEMYLQGYEYYVIDGVAGISLKTTVSRELFGFNLPWIKTKKRPRTMVPFRVFGKIYGNAGYVHNPNNTNPGVNLLTNKMLYSTGFGIDILTLYDINIKIDCSFNQIGQNGIYLHRNSNNF